MKSIQPPLPSALRSTVAERQSNLERCVENAVAAVEALDKARAAIGLGPADRLFRLSSEVDEIVNARLASAEAERIAVEKAQAQADRELAEKARARRRREREAWGEQSVSEPELVWSTPQAIFAVLDVHFAAAHRHRYRDGADFAQSLHVLRKLALGDDAQSGALEQFAAASVAALARLEQVDAALAQAAAKEAAAEEALAAGTVLPLKRRPNETTERTL